MKRQEIPKEGAAVASLECEERGPKEMESGAERWEVPTEEVARKSSRVMKKRPVKLVKLIKMCLNETYSEVHIGKHLSTNFSIQNGLRLYHHWH
jgi:hypothetical protein